LKCFNDLPLLEQYEYFDWLETLQIEGRVSMDISNEEFMEKLYRMYACDQHQGFDPDNPQIGVDFFDKI
jgi:hypothetical protein